MEFVQDMELFIFQAATLTLENGKTTSFMAKESMFMPKETGIKGSSKMAKKKASESTIM